MLKTESRLTGNILQGLTNYESLVKNKVLVTGVASTARVVYDYALTNTSPPKMTRVSGRLHNSIFRYYDPARSSDYRKVYLVGVRMAIRNKSEGAPHWHWVEYGNSRRPANPYLRPAFDRMPQAIRVGKDAMRRRLSGKQ